MVDFSATNTNSASKNFEPREPGTDLDSNPVRARQQLTEYFDGLYGSLAELSGKLIDEGLSPEEVYEEVRKREATFDFQAEALALLEEPPSSDTTPPKPTVLPLVVLPGGNYRISDTAVGLGQLLSAAQTHFQRGRAVVNIVTADDGQLTLETVSPAQATSDFEQVASLMAVNSKGDVRRAVCTETTAKTILSSRAFLDELPPLRVLSPCPIPVEDSNDLKVIAGYDEASGVFAQGKMPVEMELPQAVALLNEALDDFQFLTPSDKSRALAAFITPALVMGGLLPGRAALDLGEADNSQSGKGYRHKLTAAIYNYSPAVITLQRAGVGSLEEAFDRALISGRTFISIDNVRGKIDSPKIESFLTEDRYTARCSYSKNVEIDPRRVYVMLTSNKADITKDLANRSSCVRIRKQPDGYEFRKYEEGDILDHIRANQPLYLGAVLAVVKAWYAAGKPRSADTRHDFRGWAQTLDWIVQNLLEAAPMLDGHRETQERMTNPSLNWLRDVVLAAVRQGRNLGWLLANDLLDIIEEDGNLPIPGIQDAIDLEDENKRRQVLSQIGRLMNRCFGSEESVQVDGMEIKREEYTDEVYRPRKRYMVLMPGDIDLPF